MEYIPQWERIEQRFLAYWARENHDRPLLCIYAPKQDAAPPLPSHHADLRARWLDTDYVIARANRQFQNTYYAGEAMASFFPNLGPDVFAAMYGTPLVFGETTSWAQHNLHDLAEWQHIRLETEGFYYQKMLEMTRAVVEDAKGKYLAGVTDIHPGLDALVAMRSPETLCFDVLEDPDWVKQASVDLFEGFRTLYDELAALTTTHQRGTINWMGAWHPERWYVTSCDFCCMISPAMFEELVIPELMMELDYLDASIFHLDGPDALRHLDRLLAIPQLQGVQWVYGDGQPTAAHWIDVLKKIQKAGKCVHVNATPEDLPALLEHVPPEGVLYNIAARSEEEAAALLALAEKHTKKVF